MKVEATLVTACGCKRTIDTTFPPSPTIIMALKPKIAVFGKASDGARFPSAFSTRTFTLKDRGRSNAETWWAEYHEEV